MLSPTILEALMSSKEIKLVQRDYKKWADICPSVDRRLLLGGLMDLFGKYRTQDTKKGIQAIEMAAHGRRNDSINASIVLGIIYGYGFTGVERNVRVSKVFLRTVASFHDCTAILHLCILHKIHGKIFPTDEDIRFVDRDLVIRGIDDGLDHNSSREVKQCFLELVENAKTNKAYHIFNLALAYEYGVGTSVDKTAAVELYLKAKDAGHEFGQQYAAKLMAECGRAVPLAAPKSPQPPQQAPKSLQAQEKSPLTQGTHKREHKDTSLPKDDPKAPALKKPANADKQDLPTAAASAFAPTSGKERQKTVEHTSSKPVEAPAAVVIKKEVITKEARELSSTVHATSPAGAIQPQLKREDIAKEVVSEIGVCKDAAKSPTKDLISVSTSTTVAAKIGTPSPAPVPAVTSTTHTSITTHKEFDPRKQPSELSYADPAKFFSSPTPRKTSERKKTMPTHPEPSATQDVTEEHVEYSSQAKIDIGRWGEDFVYRLLQAHYQEKYPDCQLTQQEDGFKLTGSNDLSVEVIWHNKQGEKWDSKDLTVIKHKHKAGKTDKHYVVEVKTTTAAGQNDAFLSKNEWQQMLACRDHGYKYRIFRIRNAGKENPSVDKIKDPLQKINNGEVAVSSMTLRI